MDTDIRWQQRLSSFASAAIQLTEFIEKPELNKFEVQGLIQCFEYTFELAWKAMKDYLEAQGFEVKSPRNAIQTAFSIQLIKDGHVWLDALEKRDLMACSFDKGIIDQAKELILQKYYPVLKELQISMEKIK